MIWTRAVVVTPSTPPIDPTTMKPFNCGRDWLKTDTSPTFCGVLGPDPGGVGMTDESPNLLIDVPQPSLVTATFTPSNPTVAQGGGGTAISVQFFLDGVKQGGPTAPLINTPSAPQPLLGSAGFGRVLGQHTVTVLSTCCGEGLNANGALYSPIIWQNVTSWKGTLVVEAVPSTPWWFLKWIGPLLPNWTRRWIGPTS